MYNVGKIARQNLIDEFMAVVESSNQPQVNTEKFSMLKLKIFYFKAAMDLWNIIRYMTQLPADYLANRVSLLSQQAIVSSARSYLEYSYVMFR